MKIIDPLTKTEAAGNMHVLPAPFPMKGVKRLWAEIVGSRGLTVLNACEAHDPIRVRIVSAVTPSSFTSYEYSVG